MKRITMLSTFIWRIARVLFFVIPFIILILDPKSTHFILLYTGIAIYTIFISETKRFFNLYTIYINDSEVILKKSLSVEPKIIIPYKNALSIEYQQFAQQILARFWFVDPNKNERTCVDFWPRAMEKQLSTSSLHSVCMQGADERGEL
jgi:hypothetical protein